MAGDKKAAAGRVRFVLLEAVGRAVIRGDVDERLVRAAIAAGTPSTPAPATR
jgi:3-dehydroquinate synthetase